MGSLTVGSPVLLVGEVGARLEPDFTRAGLLCALVYTASDAVARLKAAHFPLVVVPPVLSDMAGVDFIQGVLRHFDSDVVLCGNGVDAVEVNALLNTGRVTHVPSGIDGHQVVSLVLNNGGDPPIATGMPLEQADPMGMFGATLPDAMGTAFTRTPTSSPGMQASSPPAFNPVASYPPTAPVPPGYPSYPPQYGMGYGTPAASYSVPQPTPPAPPRGPGYGSMPPVAYEDTRALQQRMAAVTDELGRANADVGALRNELQTLQGKNVALVEELEGLKTELSAHHLENESLREELSSLRTQSTDLHGKLETALGELTTQQEALAAARRAQDEARVELQEARMRLDDLQQQHASLVSERDTLRGEAGPLRDWATEVVTENSNLQGEINRLRKILEELGYEENEEKTAPVNTGR